MDEAAFDASVSKLVAHLDAAPAGSVSPAVSAAKARFEAMQKTTALLQQSVDSLRVNVKYLVFDLEATRRENDSLRLENERLRDVIAALRERRAD